MDTFATYQNKILEQWSNYGMYKLFDIKNNEKQEVFNFIAGPPFCSGKLHMGHCAIETIKSTMLNYKAMKGYQCTNKLGYDCHGLPIESIATRELNIKTTEDLERIGIENFNQFCKDTIKQCERDWEPIYNSIGRWANFNNVYKTVDAPFMESVWWAFSELYNKGLIYRGYKITPYSYALQSPLSNFEASQNYKEVDCRSIYVRFEVLPEYQHNSTPTYIVAWTTTPWTLPANIALCINPDLEYEYVEDNSNNVYILGKDKHKQSGLKISKLPIKTVKGNQLIGIKYKPIYATYRNILNDNNKAFTVVADGYVKEGGSTGTNIVHLAPIFGEDDYRVCKLHNIITDNIIQSLIPIDENCNYLSLPSIEQYASMLVFDAETLIIKDLKANNTLIKIQQIRHEYPYCYRTDTPLVYRTYNSFYVNIQPIKERMLELNGEINWYPDSTGTKRFNMWLEDAHDWCISRSRYFGTPIPVWLSEDGLDMLVISSIQQLENLSGLLLNDIHPEYINDIIINNSHNGKTYHRIPDVFDCWFESGSVPFAQHHYPFENKTVLDEHIKQNKSFADFIAEGVDQTRGWFYTLLVLSTALFDIKPSKNIMSVGHILDEHRKKISKKNKNYVDPPILINNYGADAIRLYLLQSAITNGEPLAFKEEDIKIINKDLFQFKNCVDFLLEHITNQKHHSITFDILAYHKTNNPMDKWIIQHINFITSQASNYLENYQIAKATRIILDTIEDITNWYVKFNRDRLKGKNNNDEWIISTSVLYQVIRKYIILLAPMAPFITQSIYNQLEKLSSGQLEFVHMEKYNIPISINYILDDDTNYIETFELLKRVSKLVRASRMNTKTHTSSKTPIKFCNICMDSTVMLERISSCIDLIQSELNIIDIKYSMLEGNLSYKISPIRAILGKKYKKHANLIYKEMENITFNNNISKTVNLQIDNNIYVILEDEFVYEPIFEDNDIFDTNILIKIDFTYDDTIEKLAHLKRFVAEIQQTRKHMGLKPWNKIEIHTFLDDFNIVSQNIDYIQKRLEYPVITNSELVCNLEDIKSYYPDKDENKKINYVVNVLKNDN
jgi:isoleucyl-tRNA synthetase